MHCGEKLIADPRDFAVSWVRQEQGNLLCGSIMLFDIAGVTHVFTQLIQLLTGEESVEVGHGLDSCTSEVVCSSVVLDNLIVDLLDTPGTEDSTKTDVEILQIISDDLVKRYAVKLPLPRGQDS